MGKIVFIFSVVFSFLYFLLFIIKIREKKGKPEEEIEIKPIPKNVSTSDTGVYTILGIIVLLGLGIYWCMTKYSSGNRPPPQIIQRQVSAVQVTQKEPKREEREERAVMYWDKPDGFAGDNPQKRSSSFEVMVKFKNTEIVDMVANYRSDDGTPQKTRLRVTKHIGNRTEGTWSQENPSGRGLWHLEPTTENTRIFKGEISNEEGAFIPLRLEYY